MPAHASRELLILMGSLTTCDPGNIDNCIQTAADIKIRCSVINLAAEVRVYKELASRTGGLHNVVLDDLHLRDLLSQHLDPPASATNAESSLIRMGFPSHAGRDEGGGGLGLCQCHLETNSGGQPEAGEGGCGQISTAG